MQSLINFLIWSPPKRPAGFDLALQFTPALCVVAAALFLPAEPQVHSGWLDSWIVQAAERIPHIRSALEFARYPDHARVIFTLALLALPFAMISALRLPGYIRLDVRLFSERPVALGSAFTFIAVALLILPAFPLSDGRLGRLGIAAMQSRLGVGIYCGAALFLYTVLLSGLLKVIAHGLATLLTVSTAQDGRR